MSRTADKIVSLFRGWLSEQASSINPNAVIKDIYSEVEITAGYFFVLTVANLIALCGLIMNSSPVIIGAMLVSPLMGPILSSGFAFVTGDNVIWNRSVKKISLSVALTITVAAVATYLSPLKDLTGEILSRTRPNLYDLIIAFLAGIAGASAICTKKHYLTVVPGVAIATAVIPPLSVAGFGAGSANLNIFYGGFLLFFTNFVAIVLSTCVVFAFYGFRRKMAAEVELSQMKKRFAVLIAVLIVISIPLIYTLQTSIAEVRQRTTIRDALQHTLEKEKRSHLASFTYAENSDGILEINTQVNTVSYLSNEETERAQSYLGRTLGRRIILNVEQVKVQVGGLKDGIKAPILAIAPQKSPGEIVRNSGENVRSVVRQSSEKMNKIIVPSRVVDFSVGFSDKTPGVFILLKIRRDSPLAEEQIRWLQRILANDLNLPVDLKVEAIPFVPLLVFKPGESELSEEMKKEVLTVKDIYGVDPGIALRVEAYEERAGKKERPLAEKRMERIVEVLVKECGVPRERITTAAGPRRTEPAVRISVITGQPAKGS
ncbi:TIGR00341 family protein [Geobacter argillaceus]|jgi:uncharacterized hydrophobic protein (TIGR00271 family)|uniref:Putative hydrophobic protein (TIGR00341 family) n=1 Tax=Geobacter argillaceus TaxID=345631 RepID=A0A562VF70_9BACT|nr:TIGR00341 family protein [Geobacter argillaceus]TWJ16549.1 putative hydrophobic protein (TIGR00341 family) [Geobacter argillaceus]